VTRKTRTGGRPVEQMMRLVCYLFHRTSYHCVDDESIWRIGCVGEEKDIFSRKAKPNHHPRSLKEYLCQVAEWLALILG